MQILLALANGFCAREQQEFSCALRADTQIILTVNVSKSWVCAASNQVSFYTLTTPQSVMSQQVLFLRFSGNNITARVVFLSICSSAVEALGTVLHQQKYNTGV